MLRILAIRLSSIGDIVHTLPAVAALGESLPQTEIAWAVEKRYAELLEGNPHVRRVIPLDTLDWRKRWRAAGTAAEIEREVSELRRFRADIAIDFQGLIKSAVLARLSGAPRRVGFRGQWLRESLAGIFYTESAEAPGRRHVVEENLALAEQVGARPVARERWRFPLTVSAEAARRVEQRLANLGIERFLVINPGGGWMSKRWAPERYAELIGELEHQASHTALITGSPTEEPAIREILQRANARRALYFASTVSEYIALVRRASLFVGGDTGPLHLAAAVGTPVVAIYGPTNPARNGPFAPADIALCTQKPGGGKTGLEAPLQTHWHNKERKNSAFIGGVSVDAVRAAIEQRLAAADES
jgi:lipopolysaccharide heptosyltransferase I